MLAAMRKNPLALSAKGGVVLYFVMAFEVLVMISPFAAFFYAVMNPILLFLDRWAATRWLSAFFLPHMIVPPDGPLVAIRVAGSVLFVAGALAFLVCAGQIYAAKLLRRGAVVGGAYAVIRHPQYVALSVTGIGLAILWPRFLTLVLWGAMVGVYDLLARDEERRMLAQHGEEYRAYMERTGRFLPRRVEAWLARLPGPRPAVRAALAPVLVGLLAVGAGFALRAHTVARLPLWSEGNLAALPVLPGDAPVLDHRMGEALALAPIRAGLAGAGGRPVLVYVVPPAYVMQGMIADTGPEWRLYHRHQTLPMIADWVLHPFAHLEGHHGGHAGGHGGAGGGAMTRRLIFLAVNADGPATPEALLAIDARRTPLFVADVDLHSLEVASVRPLPPGSGWGQVPTPLF
jgi:protein-S-isoprenylcysteine O-methyltransferase Ste14